LKIFEYKLPKHTYTRSRAADHSDVTSLLYSICNFDFVVSIVIVQMCLAFKKSLQVKFKRIPFKEPQFTGVGGYTYMKL
jgi:hypothetical protein